MKNDSRYYNYVMRTEPLCYAPWGCHRRAEQLHHVSLIPSSKHSGLLPRRASSYQVIPLCRICHDNMHDGKENTVGKDEFRELILPLLEGYALVTKGINQPAEHLSLAEQMLYYHQQLTV